MVDNLRVRPAAVADAAAIARISQIEFGESEPFPGYTSIAIARWTERKAPLIVACGPQGDVLGYAASKPNEARGVSRLHGQVAILSQIAVLPQSRGSGIGKALHDRTIRTLRFFGYSRVLAQLQPSLVPWYSALGWSMFAPGSSLAWIEPPTRVDDEAKSDLPGTFAPILSMTYLPRYPVLAQLDIGAEKPLAEWTIDARGSQDEISRRLDRGLISRLEEDRGLVDRLPRGLLRAIEATEPNSKLSEWLRDQRTAGT